MFSFNHTNKFLPGTTRVIVTIVVFFVVAILATVGYFAFKVNSIYQSVQAGKNDLNQAIVFMDRGELELAQRTAKEAIESFSNASQELSELQNNFFIFLLFISNSLEIIFSFHFFKLPTIQSQSTLSGCWNAVA